MPEPSALLKIYLRHTPSLHTGILLPPTASLPDPHCPKGIAHEIMDDGSRVACSNMVPKNVPRRTRNYRDSDNAKNSSPTTTL